MKRKVFRVLLYIIFILSIVFGVYKVVECKNNGKFIKDNYDLIECKIVSASDLVLRTEYKNSHNYYQSFIIEYEYNNKNYRFSYKDYNITIKYNSRPFKEYSVGDTESIYVNPKDPSECKLKWNIYKSLNSWYWLIIFGITSLIILFVSGLPDSKKSLEDNE